MDANTGRAYEDFVPPHNMVTEPATHTLTVDLSAAGYKKEHIRVQLVRSHGLVIVRGERAVAGNRWSRFRLEFRVPDGCDVKAIHAKFEGGVVRVTMPGIKTGPAALVVGKLPEPTAGYSYLVPERRKLVTTLVGALLVLFSLGIYVRYSFGP